MNSVYICFDDIKLERGTKVFYHEIQALKQASDLKLVVAKSYPGTDVPFKALEFTKWYQFNPFLADYFAAQLIPPECYGIDFMYLACQPGLAILNTVRPKKYVVHMQAHDLRMSIEEHERMYGAGSYPFVHNTDPYLHKLLLKVVDNSTAVVTASTTAAKWTRENTEALNMVLIPHGCAIPDSVEALPPNLRFGYLGAFGPDKGLPYLLMAWRHLPSGLSAELVFGGSHCEYIKQLAVQIDPGLSRQIYLGWLNSVSDFYNQISVYIQPSVTEGFGIEVAEAMSFGRPVIVTSTTGAMDLITDGVDGFIIPPRDPRALLEKMLFFHEHPGKILEMGNRAREKAPQFSWEKVEQQYIQFFKRMADGT